MTATGVWIALGHTLEHAEQRKKLDFSSIYLFTIFVTHPVDDHGAENLYGLPSLDVDVVKANTRHKKTMTN